MNEARLGLRENLAQFSLLVIVNGFVGAMVGMERSVLPSLAEQVFHLAAKSAVLSFIVVFGVTKALTKYLAGDGPIPSVGSPCSSRDGSLLAPTAITAGAGTSKLNASANRAVVLNTTEQRARLRSIREKLRRPRPGACHLRSRRAPYPVSTAFGALREALR